MKKNSHFRSFTLLTTALLTTGGLFSPKEARATIAVEASLQANAIEIYVPPPENPVSTGVCPAFIAPTIESIISRPALAQGRWGIVVQSLENGEILYSRNPNQQLIPASNVKLLTTAAVLQHHDPATTFRSSSLASWINRTNLVSDNNYANILLSFVGGSGRVRDTLSSLGISPSGFRQVDGSGLSRQNTSTAQVMVDLLRAMPTTSSWAVFYDSLPVGGVSGTLRNRFQNPAVRGRVRAKTGTLRGVRTLSGYIEHPTQGKLAFSVLANHPNLSNQTGSALVQGIDEIVLRLAQLDSCQ